MPVFVEMFIKAGIPEYESWISTAPGRGGVTVAGDLSVTLFYLVI